MPKNIELTDQEANELSRILDVDPPDCGNGVMGGARFKDADRAAEHR